MSLDADPSGYEDGDPSTLYVYHLHDGARVSEDSLRLTPVPSPESNENPRVDTHYTELADEYRDLDFDPGRTRRGYIAYFLNPAQWSLGSDYFTAGKVMTGKQNATNFQGGMRADSPQRANIQPVPVSSYGDLLTASTDGVGVDPYAGW